MMRIDLHSHTTCSDGTFSPTALVQEAARRGVDVLAITDHDTTAALVEAQAEGRRQGVRVLWGVELSARDGGEVHILSYFRDQPPEPFYIRQNQLLAKSGVTQLISDLPGCPSITFLKRRMQQDVGQNARPIEVTA